MIGLGVVVLGLGIAVPFFMRWKKRRTLEQEPENLSFTNETVPAPKTEDPEDLKVA
jgi:hypothetical protein